MIFLEQTENLDLVITLPNHLWWMLASMQKFGDQPYKLLALQKEECHLNLTVSLSLYQDQEPMQVSATRN